MDSSEEEIYAGATAAIASVMALVVKKRKPKKRTVWTRNWLQRREEGRDVLHMLNNELLVEDAASYTNFLRLPNNLFEKLLGGVEADISRQDTVMRDSISAVSRLQITLRFLATGESFRSLMYATRVHESTISRFVPEVCQAIYNNFKDVYLKIPSSEEEWTNIAKSFYEMWDFPNCLGALDGRHIKFRAPRSSGSFFYNYKGDFSIVLLGMADAGYKFTYANVGVNGRISDGGVLRRTSLWQSINDNTLHFPDSIALPGRQQKMPYVIVADDAFPLCTRIMKPYPDRDLIHSKRIFNYRLSRARCIIENAFGILANRFRILLNPIMLVPEKVEIITLCCVVLHNFLLTEAKTTYLPTCDTNPNDVIVNNLEQILLQGGNRNSADARNVRDEFRDFFNSAGARDWQEAQVAKNNM